MTDNHSADEAFEKYIHQSATSLPSPRDIYRAAWIDACAYQQAADVAAVEIVIDEWEAAHAHGGIRRLVFGQHWRNRIKALITGAKDER